jgi:hypothetical protein
MNRIDSADIARTAFTAALALLLAAGIPSRAQETQGANAFPRPNGVSADPQQTSRGSWTGTWFLRDRAAKIAIWFELNGSKPKVRYRYELAGGSAYGDSKENGKGDSLSRIGPGSFTFTYTLGKDDVLRGRMVREWKNATTTVTESNDFYAFRAEPGDQLFFRFLNYQQETIEAGKDGQPPTRKVIPLDATFFNFEKATDEIVHWEELPFSQ